MAILKIAAHCLLSFYRAGMKIRSYAFIHLSTSRPSHLLSLYPSAAKCLLEKNDHSSNYSMICDFHGSLLRSSSLFPFFAAVAFEGGGILRSILLFLSFPLVLLLGQNSEAGLKVMVFVTFCGLRTMDMGLVARAVLPKVYLEDLHRHGYEAMERMDGRKVVVTSLPRVMVQGFLEEYLGVNEVVAPEIGVVRGRYYTGILIAFGGAEGRIVALEDLIKEDKVDIGLVSSSNPVDQLLIPYCKDVYVVTKEDSSPTTTAGAKNATFSSTSCCTKLPREKYPKPLIFHDGRLAILPTPSATLYILLWLPLAIPISVMRILSGVLFPPRLAVLLGAGLGVHIRVTHPPNHRSAHPNSTSSHRGVLYVCTHRTLLDPIFLSLSLSRSVSTVTYSLSPFSEVISPIPTVRLTRERCRDAATIHRLLAAGDLAICPEGTTCREPYLLRFSPLFAELASDIQPVAMDALGVSMFYGTTASGLKSLDPIFFFMNPRPRYHVTFLRRVPPEMTVAGGWPAADVANRIQRELADALAFKCTTLTRRDKYLMLVGNDGAVGKKTLKSSVV